MLTRSVLVCCLVVVTSVLADDTAQFQKVKGRFTLSGEIPHLGPLVKGEERDEELCGNADIPDESLIVNRENRGIANIVLFPVKTPEPIRPDLIEPSPLPLEFTSRDCRYFPHVLVVRTGQPVVVTSDDFVVHNVRSAFIRNAAFCFSVLPKDHEGVLIDNLSKPEPLPMPTKCDIHPWMTAYWVVVDHPYVAVTDPNGRFEIEGLPVGKHVFKVWHERAGYLDKEFAIEIQSGSDLDLGSRSFDVSEFRLK